MEDSAMFKKLLMVGALLLAGTVSSLAITDTAEARGGRYYRGGYYGGYNYRPSYGYRSTYYRPYYGNYYSSRPYYSNYYSRPYYSNYYYSRPYYGGYNYGYRPYYGGYGGYGGYGTGVYVGRGGVSIGF